ncbi:vitamin K epoxide reductase family protein [Aporhodopirellula aestuarii]
MLTCSTIAIATSIYLAWSALTLSPVAGCSGGSVFDCHHVLHSRWSKVLGVPVSVPAIATHACVIGLLLVRPSSVRWQRLRWSGIGLASLAAGGAAIWFIGLQIFALGHLCPYCLVAHVAGLVLAGVFLWSHPVKASVLRWIAGGASAALAVLITLQVNSEPPQTFETIEHGAAPTIESDSGLSEEATEEEFFAPPPSVSLQHQMDETLASWNIPDLSRLTLALANPATLVYGDVGASQAESAKTVQILGGVKLSTKDWPLIGSPDAEIVFVEMFDYTCPHCQRTHASLKAAKEHFGDRLAVIVLPVPLDGKCNPTVQSTHASHAESCELAKLAVAVWMSDREKFAEFHNYLFESKPNYSQAVSHAASLVGKSKLDGILQGSVPGEYVKRHVQLYQKAGAGTIPKLLFSRTTTVGAVESPQTMIQLINQNR